MAYNYNSPYGMGTQYPQQTYPVSNYQQPSYQPINANLGAKTLPYATKEEVQAQILPPNSQMTVSFWARHAIWHQNTSSLRPYRPQSMCTRWRSSFLKLSQEHRLSAEIFIRS